jgi:hypothetical protein
VRRLELVPALDRAIEGAPKIGHLAPIKVRDRGASPGELRAVAEIPAASTAAGLARRFRRTHLRAAEAAFARAANHFDRELGRDAGKAVTLDFDSSQVEVYGRKKPGASVNYQGQLAYQPLLAVWAERGRTLATELLAGSASTKGEESRALLRRTLAHLPAGHGEVSVRLDSGFYRIDLLCDCRERGARFSVSVPHSSAMWAALEAIEEEDWRAAEAMERAEVAETSYRPAGWKAEPLRLIVRRVAHRAAELSEDPRARRRTRSPPSSSPWASRAAPTPSTATRSCSPTSWERPPMSSATTASAPRSRSASRTTSSASRCATCPSPTSRPTASGSTPAPWPSGCWRYSATFSSAPIRPGPAATAPGQVPAAHAPLRARAHRPPRARGSPAPARRPGVGRGGRARLRACPRALASGALRLSAIAVEPSSCRGRPTPKTGTSAGWLIDGGFRALTYGAEGTRLCLLPTPVVLSGPREGLLVNHGQWS